MLAILFLKHWRTQLLNQMLVTQRFPAGLRPNLISEDSCGVGKLRDRGSIGREASPSQGLKVRVALHHHVASSSSTRV